jgi:3-hydroxyisobutyrate dehydrogenase-like beta-hydroxyacid dehydrogenase
MSTTIGFIGIGTMGQPIARNLLKAGYTVRVYNRDTQKTDALVAEGAQRGTHPADVVEPGGIVFSIVSNDTALESITLGKAGILERLGPDGIHVSMSTVSQALAKRLTEIHSQQHCMYVAAPVFGRPEAAAARKLWICLAGASAAKERVRPLLNTISQALFDFGEEPDCANVVKLCGNFLIGAAMEAMAEVLAVAEKNGIERQSIINMIGQTMFACPIYQNYGRMVAEKVYQQSDRPVGFQLKLALKDTNLLLDAAEQAAVPMPFADLTHNRLLNGVAKGRGNADWVAVTQSVNEDAGLD